MCSTNNSSPLQAGSQKLGLRSPKAAWLMPNKNSTMAIAMLARPGRSGLRARLPGIAGSSAGKSSRLALQMIGTSKKDRRQLMVAIQPPIREPLMKPTTISRFQRPRAALTPAAGVTKRTLAKVLVSTEPRAMPVRARPSRKRPASPDSIESRFPTTASSSEAASTRRRPKRSPKKPITSTDAAWARVDTLAPRANTAPCICKASLAFTKAILATLGSISCRLARMPKKGMQASDCNSLKLPTLTGLSRVFHQGSANGTRGWAWLPVSV